MHTKPFSVRSMTRARSSVVTVDLVLPRRTSYPVSASPGDPQAHGVKPREGALDTASSGNSRQVSFPTCPTVDSGTKMPTREPARDSLHQERRRTHRVSGGGGGCGVKKLDRGGRAGPEGLIAGF